MSTSTVGKTFFCLLIPGVVESHQKIAKTGGSLHMFNLANGAKLTRNFIYIGCALTLIGIIGSIIAAAFGSYWDFTFSVMGIIFSGKLSTVIIGSVATVAGLFITAIGAMYHYKFAELYVDKENTTN